MQNEYYYLNALENKMQEFIEEESGESDFGYVADNLVRRMAEAAFAVLKNNREINDYFLKEDMLKSDHTR